MQFVSALSTEGDGARAVADALEQAATALDGGAADVVLAFIARYPPEDHAVIAKAVREAYPHATFLGCTADGVIGGHREVERRESLALLAGSLPGVTVTGFQLEPLHPVTAEQVTAIPVPDGAEPSFITLADPYTCDAQGFLDHVNTVWPGRPVVGGLASGPHQNRMFLNDTVLEGGLVGVALSGNVRLDTVVSQGCRPIGRHFVITKGKDNVIYELGGKKATEALQELTSSLTEEEQKLLRRGLFVGRVIDEYKSSFSRGDFLIQGVMGVDLQSGSIGITGLALAGTTIQFHVRDADSADEDLRELLKSRAGGGVAHSGGLLFSCTGRGTMMWKEPGHDVGVVRELCGEPPVAGLFCAGELGPIGGRNFIHGFTASIGLIRPAHADEND